MDQHTRPCEFCGTPLATRQKRCCGAPACKKAQLRANTRAWRDAGNVEKQETRTCEVCGEEFTTLARSATRLCSRACVTHFNVTTGVMARASKAGEAARKKPRTRPCKTCGEAFEAYGSATRCSAICRYLATHPSSSTVYWPTCLTCRQAFPSRQEHRSYCSRRCNWSRPRRWRKHAIEVHERDRWICQICGDPTTRAWDCNDPLSATLDHIKPRSRGGGDNIENLRTAHARCNSIRGNRDDGDTVVLTA